MPDKYIQIVKSELPRSLSQLSNSRVDSTVLRIPSTDVAAAMTILNTIDEENWISSNTLVQPEGETTEIRVPKKAVTG